MKCISGEPLPFMAHMAGQVELLASYPDLLTVNHVCELTGLSAQTVRKEINEGRLPGFHIGRKLFMSKQGFLDYIKEGGGAHVPHVVAR
ncbi:helix-turn-helix domain-containing protein [Arabiibacter massiliensis]|uniref:helix-turn-helix domain-containing protein n=1 Tax=Arabiibacter massiliensis TaxID=1870985 RepID=UPI0009B9CDD8|nr:helix-turn-helix domain-containing protein [Arabiibacter massiliensis]